jgi:ankyrin repeat protein
MADLKTFHEGVKTGNLSAVRDSLASDRSLLNANNEAGQNAILLSKYYGQPAVTDYLLSFGPELDVFTAAAVGDANAVFAHLEQDKTLIEKHSGDGWTVLHLAAFFGHKELAEQLIGRGAFVDARSTNAMKNTPLHAAAAGRKGQLVRLLLEHGAQVNATQEGGWTALHAAAQNGDREIVETLLAHGSDVNARAGNNQSALDLALLKGRQDVVELLDELSKEPR